MYNFQGKKVLVAGGTGLIGIPLVRLLVEEGARVRIVSLDDPSRAHPEAEFRRLDLLNYENCLGACEGVSYVFNLLCVKGSPEAARDRAAVFFDHNLLLDTNLLRASRAAGVEGYLLASSLAVYPPAEVFHEDSAWKTFPSENDLFAGWAKLTAELQTRAYRRQYVWGGISIVRPANTYGPYDDFESDAAMVIPSLIRKAVNGENPLRIWGDGRQVRDFIYAEDVARGMMLAAKLGVEEPVNLGSGIGYTIREVVEIICSNLISPPEVLWDTSKPTGDPKRVLDVERARSLGFRPLISLAEGIRKTMRWYESHKESEKNKRFNVFSS